MEPNSEQHLSEVLSTRAGPGPVPGADPALRKAAAERARGRARYEALVGLLDDDSTQVVASARDALARAGRQALPALRRGARSPSAGKRARARALLAAVQQEHAIRRLTRYASRDEIDLEAALFLLGRLDAPRLDARPYRKALDAMGSEVARRASTESDDFARPMVLCQYLGNELGFVGSEVQYDHPANVHLHRAIERKRGMPLTLTAIYLLVARRAGIRAAALALPGHVLLRLYAGRRSMIVDPFRGGRMRTRADCVRYLAQNGLVPRPDWFHDASDSQLFRRHVRNLMNSAQTRGLHGLARGLLRVDRPLARL